MVSKVGRRKLSEEVSNGILQLIQRDRIEAGQRLPIESELVEMFQVSRTAVREGIRSLVAIGLLQTTPGRGTFVVDSSLGILRDPLIEFGGADLSRLLELLEFRRIVEPETAALAAQRRTPEDLQELGRCVSELEKSIPQGIKPPEDIGFHLALSRASHNSALVDASFLIFRFYQNDPSLPDTLDLISHRAIFEAVREGDAAAARQAMRGHFEDLEKRYRAKASGNHRSQPGTIENGSDSDILEA
jgi:GntR family transcriptional repressor for pyruvate dehydrogenase complex